MTRTVAVDFDGVIHAYRRGWQDGTIYDEPVPGALKALRMLLTEFAVYVHTARKPAPVCAWLCERGIPAVTGMQGAFWDVRDRVLVTDRKLPAIAYIDDRGIRFTDWAQALADLNRFTGGCST
jgi:hypothetical protein